MKTISRTAIALSCLLAITACNKKPAEEAATPAAPAVVTAPAAPAPAAEPTAEERERAEKEARLAYSMMEDQYINDPKAQWATSAKASSTFGEKGDSMPRTPEESRAWKATGKPDGYEWSQLNHDTGMDWLELGFATPVQATAVRAVFISSEAVESIAKVELIDVSGAAIQVWSGLSDVKPDQRGDRTWFVREFPKTEKKIQGVKLTFANAVASGFKQVDAVQLIGE